VTTDGVFTEHTVPTSSSGPFYITAGNDLNMWFTERDANQIGVLKGICKAGDGSGTFAGTNGNGNFKFHHNDCDKKSTSTASPSTGYSKTFQSTQTKGVNFGTVANILTTTTGFVNSTNRGDGKAFYSTQINSVKFDLVANTITLTGLGTSGGLPVSFTFVALATGLTTPGWVSFAFSDGYVNAGLLTSGSIVLTT